MAEPAALPDTTALDLRFRGLPAEHASRGAEAYEAVAHWEWYSREALDLRPLHYEFRLVTPGRPVADRPALTVDHLRVGFDADGRPAVLLTYSGFLGAGGLDRETFRVYGDGVVEEAQYDKDGLHVQLRQFVVRDGLVRSGAWASRYGAGYETYEYTGGLPTRVTVHHADVVREPTRRLGPLVPAYLLRAEYDGTVLRRLELDRRGATDVVYERPGPGFSLDDAIARVRDELVRQVPATVRAGPAEGGAAYCVALSHQPGGLGEALVCVGFEAHRRLRLDDDEAIYLSWAPAEFGVDTPVDLSAVASDARIVAQELSLADSEHPGVGAKRWRATLRAAAAELNEVDWTPILPVTDDFIVYAADPQLADFDRDLSACVPPGRLALLRRRGLLPDAGTRLA